MPTTLPAGFEDLEPYSDWALPTEYERAARRRASSPEQLKSFYEKAVSRLPALLKEVDRYPIGGIPESHRPLFHLALSLAEVAPHVELYRLNPNVPHAFDEGRLRGTHCGVAD